MGSYWLKVNIALGNSLVPWSTKPLPKPMLTQFYVTMMSLSHNELIDSWGDLDPSSICGRARSQSIRVTYFIDRVFIFAGDTSSCHNNNLQCSRRQWGWHCDSSCWSSANVLSDSSLCLGIAYMFVVVPKPTWNTIDLILSYLILDLAQP